MEFFIYNVPTQFDKYQVKGALAQVLHAPGFFHWKENFDVHIFHPKPEAPDRGTGVVMIPDPSVGYSFLEVYGGEHSTKTFSIGGNRIFFSESDRPPPNPDFVETISRTPWVDPTWERVREERERSLSHLFVTLQSIQFGWMCRDDFFSIESEAPRSARLRFNHHRRELLVTVQEAYNSTTEYTIAIRPPSILRMSCHKSTFDGNVVIFLQLETAPMFFNRLIPLPGVKRLEPYQRLTTFPLVNNPSAIPYTSHAIRLVLLSPSGADAFAHLCELANLRNLVESFTVQVIRRHLFSQIRLQQMDISIRQIGCWSIAFQLERLVRNLCVDPSEVMEIIPTVKDLMKSHGQPFVAQALDKFAPLSRDFLYTNPSSSILFYFNSFIQEFVAQGDLEPDTPNDLNYYSSLHVTITPTSMFLEGPYVDKANRVIRRYGPASQENFLRVEFRDENNLQYRFDKDVDSEGFIRERIGPIMDNGLVIAGRKFSFLAYSQSALKEHSVWFVKTFNHPTYGIITAERIIQSLGNFRDLKYDPTLVLCPARFGARISQAFSATDAAVVDVDEIIICDDITTSNGRYIFTDGSGGMSKELAQEIWQTIGRKGWEEDFPHAYQIRFQGSKGMISVDHTLNGSNALSLRPSMIKFDAPDSTEIEISRAIDQPTAYFLNRPLIMILEGLGVPYQVFQDFQDEAVRETKEATQSLSAAAHLFQTHGLGISFKLPSTMQNLAKLGLERLPEDSFFNQSLRIGVYHVLRDLKHRARIPIPNAWTLVGVADTHRYLKENQVFVCIEHRDEGTFYLEGPVLISRSPTIHPGDVQLAQAIGKPPRGSCFSRESLPNTVVFSVKGERPLPTCLGGGDLDGDLYNIIPLRDHPYFAPERTYKPADYLPAAKEFVNHPCTMKDVAEFVMKYILSDVVGLVATNWLIIADQKGNITNPECLQLAKLHSDAVDYQKTGRKVELDSIPKPPLPRPDWSAPETIENIQTQDGKYYRSESALGKLTRSIDLSTHEPRTRRPKPRARRGGRTVPDDVDDIADNLSTLTLDDTTVSAILDVIKPLVSRFIHLLVRVKPNVSEAILFQFKQFSGELRGIALRYSLSHRQLKPLSEEEVIVGTITQRTSQTRMRKEKISKLKDATDYAYRRVRDALEGDDERTPREYLIYAWNAWKFSLNEMKRETFGAKAFWWISLGAIFDAMKAVEDAENFDSRSSRSGRSRRH